MLTTFFTISLVYLLFTFVFDHYAGGPKTGAATPPLITTSKYGAYFQTRNLATPFAGNATTKTREAALAPCYNPRGVLAFMLALHTRVSSRATENRSQFVTTTLRCNWLRTYLNMQKWRQVVQQGRDHQSAIFTKKRRKTLY
jgi:hypothetical protein